MSYETTYSLSWAGDSPTPEEIARALAESVDGSTPGQMDYEDVTSDWNEMLDGERTETRRHSHEKDLGQVSSMWPNTLFMLSMRGEGGERHRDYYLNGMVQTCRERSSSRPSSRTNSGSHGRIPGRQHSEPEQHHGGKKLMTTTVPECPTCCDGCGKCHRSREERCPQSPDGVYCQHWWDCGLTYGLDGQSLH